MEIASIYQKIREIFGKLPEDFTIQEDQIDIQIQMEYFEYARKYKRSAPLEEVLSRKELLFTEELTLEEKKILIVQLAGLDNVEAFRAIESNLVAPNPELKDWLRLAFQESKLFLESYFLEQNKVFISTGLGGKGMKLRYFIMLSTTNMEVLNETQKNIIKLEFESILAGYNSDLEKIEYGDTFFTVLAMVPINVSVKTAFERAVTECNLYGNFLSENFIISNIKTWTIDELKEFLKNNKDLSDPSDLFIN